MDQWLPVWAHPDLFSLHYESGPREKYIGVPYRRELLASLVHDDMSLYCATSQGLVIILGCAHAGLANIVAHARKVTGRQKVYGIIGGTHLGP